MAKKNKETKEQVYTTSAAPIEVVKVEKPKSTWLLILIVVGLFALVWWILSMTVSAAQAKPEPACKVENAECKTNDSNKLCCSGLVCMDKGVPSENGKCQAEPTPTPTPEPTPTPAPVCPTWTCGECQEGVEAVEALEARACVKEDKYCKDTYGCEWVCPTEDKCKKDEKVWECNCPPEPTPTPEVTPTVTPEPTPEPTAAPKVETYSAPASNPSAPSCGDTNPEKAPINFHVYRSGSEAQAKWWPAEGADSVAIFYKHPDKSEWEHSVIVANSGYYLIAELGSDDWTFAAQSRNGCGASPMTNAVVDGATRTWVLFTQ